MATKPRAYQAFEHTSNANGDVILDVILDICEAETGKELAKAIGIRVEVAHVYPNGTHWNLWVFSPSGTPIANFPLVWAIPTGGPLPQAPGVL